MLWILAGAVIVCLALVDECWTQYATGRGL